MIRTETVSWYWHRLRAMDSAEIAGRIAEKTRALNERRSLAQLQSFQLGAPQASLERLLPDPAGTSIEMRAIVTQNAAAVREGRWLLYGWKEINMPDPPAWDWDAAHDRRAPLQPPVSQIDHRRLANGADPRSVWEVNRWSELVRLAQNAWLNSRLDDGRLAQRWLHNWIERNPASHGINWTSPLEAAIRLLHFTWLDLLLRAAGGDEMRLEQERLAARIVPAHAWWVWRHRSFGSSANNHLIGELAALVVAARRWPCLMHVACCAEKAWQMLQAEVLRQFAPDGGNREQALHYHLFAWSLAWQARLVMGPGSAEFESRIAQAAAFFCKLTHAREPWDFGDSDDAEITPFTAERRHEVSEWKAWLLSGKSEPKFSEHDEGHRLPLRSDDVPVVRDSGMKPGEMLRLWLGAPPTLPRLETAGWHVFPDSGQCVKTAGSWMARLDASPLGFGSMAAHGHLDALHFSLWHGDQAVLIDPGTGAYHSDAVLRARLADWAAHNAPVPVGGRHAPKRGGPFLWTQHHEAPMLRVEGETAEACLACDGPFVKRRVRLDESGCEITDHISTDIPHSVSWTLAPDWLISENAVPGQYTMLHACGLRLHLHLESNGPHEASLVTRVVAPRFLDVESAQVLRVRFCGMLKTVIKAVVTHEAVI